MDAHKRHTHTHRGTEDAILVYTTAVRVDKRNYETSRATAEAKSERVLLQSRLE